MRQVFAFIGIGFFLALLQGCAAPANRCVMRRVASTQETSGRASLMKHSSRRSNNTWTDRIGPVRR